MTTFTDTRTTTFHVFVCPSCGTEIGVPAWLWEAAHDGDKRRASINCIKSACGTQGWNWWRHYEDKLKAAERRAEAERTRADAALDQLEAAERSRAALKGVVTKTRNRIGKGVCPCCNRHFTNVERHMSTQHPEYAQ